MFQSGEKVVLVNDKFPHFIALYDQIPKKGITYTVRDVRMGRIDVSNPNTEEKNMEVAITLNEIKNGPDPHYTEGFVELAFNATRFRKLDEVKEVKKHVVHQGMLF